MDIVAALRSRAEMSAKAMQLMAQSKSERNQAAGDAGASYDGGTREQTVEWRAAEEIERLRSLLRRAIVWDKMPSDWINEARRALSMPTS